jgi:predicted RNase H-like HicB family nuclease
MARRRQRTRPRNSQCRSQPLLPSTFTAVISKDGRSFVAQCPELDVASQGSTRERAKANLIEAVDLLLECADDSEIRRRLQNAVA